MDTRKHTNNLQKSSVLFLQLGLVLTLLTTYLALELKTEQRIAIIIETSIDSDDTYEFFPAKEIQIERKVKERKFKPVTKKIFTGEIKKNNKPDEVETQLPFDNEPTVNPTPNILKGLVEIPKEDPLVADYFSVQEVPIFPGCEKVKESKRRACFEKKLHKFVQKKFNGELSIQLGLPSGVQKIYVQFLITKTGDIEVIGGRAPHKKLMTEGKRVVKKLPRMIPGKQNGKEVGVKYMLPISFNVE
ncbi:MAG: energy transducer TonB [Lutibacter sp.]|nr:MAG: energy transducer TonB [Lutibacter sp.]